jgi:hypothetical protein
MLFFQKRIELEFASAVPFFFKTFTLLTLRDIASKSCRKGLERYLIEFIVILIWIGGKVKQEKQKKTFLRES